jgi:hypothetical protein
VRLIDYVDKNLRSRHLYYRENNLAPECNVMMAEISREACQ